MGRKPIPDFKIQQIILMTAQGEKTKAISDVTGITIPTVTAYQKKYAQAIEGKREELDIPPSPEQKNKKTVTVDSDTTKDSSEKKEKPDPILVSATTKFVNKSSDSMSLEMTRRFNDALKGGLVVLDAQMKYLKSLDEMGISWDKFVDFSFKLGYDTIENAYIRELEQERVRNRDTAMQIEETLHNEEVEDIESSNEGNLIRRLLKVEEV